MLAHLQPTQQHSLRPDGLNPAECPSQETPSTPYRARSHTLITPSTARLRLLLSESACQRRYPADALPAMSQAACGRQCAADRDRPTSQEVRSPIES